MAVDINRWFDRYSVTAPGGANHALALLRQMFNQAILRRHVQSNPTRGIKMNPDKKITRFLSRTEIARLHDTLDPSVAERPSRQPAADVIRLLLLTGCRRAEITDLKWQEVSDDSLHRTFEYDYLIYNGFFGGYPSTRAFLRVFISTNAFFPGA